MFLNSISIERNKLTLFERVSLRCFRLFTHIQGTSRTTPKHRPAFQYNKIRPFILPQTNKAIVAENTLFKF